MFGFGNMVPVAPVAPVDRESCRVLAAFQYLRLREKQETERFRSDQRAKYKYEVPPPDLSPSGKELRAGLDEIRERFERKEVELLRRVSGPFAKIVDAR